MKNENISEYKNIVVNLRRELHKIPELSYEEFETQKFILDFLKKEKIENVKSVFNTGVCAVIGNEENPCIAIRCDIDALPVEEKTGLFFASRNIGKMHACAHDGHTAILLTLAKYLKENEDKLQKCIKLIFQPGEETDGGARQMIELGVLENPHVNEVYGYHLWNGIDCGKVTFSKGVAFASATRFEIIIKGKGGHGAMPETVINSLYPTAYIIKEFEKINNKYPNAVVSLCTCNTDGIHNVFCENVLLMGTIRTIEENDYENIKKDIISLEKIVYEKYKCFAKTKFVYEYPCAVNNEQVLGKMVKAAKDVLGDENVYETDNTFATEDFAYFTQFSKAAHIKIGVSNSENPCTLLPLHNPKFDIDEAALFYAFEILCKLCFFDENNKGKCN